MIRPSTVLFFNYICIRFIKVKAGRMPHIRGDGLPAFIAVKRISCRSLLESEHRGSGKGKRFPSMEKLSSADRL